MKATVKAKEKVSKEEYPILKKCISNGWIVRFTAKNEGMVIKGGCQFGFLADDWAEENFEVFTGEVILKNI